MSALYRRRIERPCREAVCMPIIFEPDFDQQREHPEEAVGAGRQDDEQAQQEQRRAAPFEQRAHHPHVSAVADGIAPRQVIAGADRQQEERVQIGEDARGGGRYAEERRQAIGGQQ